MHSVLPLCPRLPLASAASTAAADGSAPSTRPSELPVLSWSLELLRRWGVRGTWVWACVSVVTRAFLCLHTLDCSVCLLSVSMSPGTWSLWIWFVRKALSSSGSYLSSLDFPFLKLSSMFPNSNSRMQFVPVLRL